jgi:hypothetical protein
MCINDREGSQPRASYLGVDCSVTHQVPDGLTFLVLLSSIQNIEGHMEKGFPQNIMRNNQKYGQMSDQSVPKERGLDNW